MTASTIEILLAAVEAIDKVWERLDELQIELSDDEAGELTGAQMAIDDKIKSIRPICTEDALAKLRHAATNLRNGIDLTDLQEIQESHEFLAKEYRFRKHEVDLVRDGYRYRRQIPAQGQ
jgi:hypothetical protein